MLMHTRELLPAIPAELANEPLDRLTDDTTVHYSVRRELDRHMERAETNGHPAELPFWEQARYAFEQAAPAQLPKIYGELALKWFHGPPPNPRLTDLRYGAADTGMQVRLWGLGQGSAEEFSLARHQDGTVEDLRLRWSTMVSKRLEQGITPQEEVTYVLVGANRLLCRDMHEKYNPTDVTERAEAAFEAIVQESELDPLWVELQREDLIRVLNWGVVNPDYKEQVMAAREKDREVWKEYLTKEELAQAEALSPQQVYHWRLGDHHSRMLPIRYLMFRGLLDAAHRQHQQHIEAWERGALEPHVVIEGAFRLARAIHRGPSWPVCPPGEVWLPLAERRAA